MCDSYPVNAINHYHQVVHDKTPQASAPPRTGRKRVLHRLASVSNTWLTSAAPIGETLCRMADNYPLSLMLLAVGATLAISGPSVYIIPVCTAALMISVGRLIKIRAVLSNEPSGRQQHSEAEHGASSVNHGGFFTRKAAYPPVPPLTSMSTPMQTFRSGLTPTLPTTPAPASKPGDTPVSFVINYGQTAPVMK
ncbi:hypothetical protein [Sodalis praecaptivus]|uniref:hypothetical protein n=1 Tax=Sodalis TaxID=84565 RepID=UPI0011DD0121|nr:hypothetical protein [Sodalis praecaptivus]